MGTRIALIVDGAVERIVMCGTDWKSLFPEGVEAGVANVGDLWDGENFSAPAAAAPTTADLLAAAASKRWLVEVGGIVVDGIPVATDDRSKSLLRSTASLAYVDSDASYVFKAADGTLHTLTAAAFIAISDAVAAHVNASFTTYAAVVAQIEAGTLTTLADIDAAAWPANG